MKKLVMMTVMLLLVSCLINQVNFGLAIGTEISSARFELLKEKLQTKQTQTEQLNYLRIAKCDNYFLVAQAVELLKFFKNEQERLKAAEMLYPNIVDKENYEDLLLVFSLPESKTILVKFIELYERASIPGMKNAISEKRFGVILQQLANETPEQNRLILLQRSTAKHDYSISQVIQIMKLMSSDYARVETVKILYFQMVDLRNSFQLEEVIVAEEWKIRLNEVLEELRDLEKSQW